MSLVDAGLLEGAGGVSCHTALLCSRHQCEKGSPADISVIVQCAKNAHCATKSLIAYPSRHVVKSDMDT